MRMQLSFLMFSLVALAVIILTTLSRQRGPDKPQSLKP